MSKYEIVYKMMTFPTSEKYRVFRVLGDVIYQIISPKAYNLDTGEIEYFDFIFDDMVTAEIIADYLNKSEVFYDWKRKGYCWFW